jgi:cytochrome oxidase Cu insertion factor (SCO1/SenC/PrrC family)
MSLKSNLSQENLYNFSLPDTNGVYHSLKELKGKVVILDFWFTGCGACKTMVSAFKIEPSLKSKEIEFVSINVDKTLPRWKEGIGYSLLLVHCNFTLKVEDMTIPS